MSQSVDRVVAGLAAMTSTVLASDSTGVARNLATVIAGVLPDRPLVGLVIRDLGADIGGRQVTPIERAAGEALLERCRRVVESADPTARASALQETASLRVCPILTPSAEVIGALGILALRPGVFDGDTLALFADHLGVLCEAVADRNRQVRSTEQLYAALSSRAGLDRALGILMGQRKCGRDEAFDILRRASNHRNVKVGRVAADIVASVSGTRAESQGRVTGSQ